MTDLKRNCDGELKFRYEIPYHTRYEGCIQECQEQGVDVVTVLKSPTFEEALEALESFDVVDPLINGLVFAHCQYQSKNPLLIWKNEKELIVIRHH
jgi:hypothetical protein